MKEVESLAPHVATHVISSQTGEGLDSLISCLREGQTTILIGSSGVGKSTLINGLMGTETLKTNEVRSWDHRGRHTTTKRMLLHLPTGGMIIDTPGIRELQLVEEQVPLEEAFPEIIALSTSCKFRDCLHEAEPRCAVKGAVEKGALSQERLANYQKLKFEIDQKTKSRQTYRGSKGGK